MKQLIDLGIMPDQCRHFALVIDAADVIRIKSEVFVSEEQLQQIANALRDNPEEVKVFARTVVFTNPKGNLKVEVDL